MAEAWNLDWLQGGLFGGEAKQKGYLMNITVLDTETGERLIARGQILGEWIDGNFTCDCNRAMFFGEQVYEEMVRRTAARFPDTPPGKSCCFGSVRFLAVKCESARTSYTPCDIRRLNADYPAELVEKHLGILNKDTGK
jgi:hypothetical protein